MSFTDLELQDIHDDAADDCEDAVYWEELGAESRRQMRIFADSVETQVRREIARKLRAMPYVLSRADIDSIEDP